MKTIQINTVRILNLMLFIVIYSCDSFVEVELPKSQLTTKVVFENYATADAALTDIYSKIRDKGMLNGASGVSSQLGNYTDETVPFGSPSNQGFSFYNNALLPTSSTITEYWNASYNIIYAANAVLEGTQESTALTPKQKNQLTGEALFIRGLSHFYLANTYGSIPYITGTDFKKNGTVSRVALSDVYTAVKADLLKSNSLLTTLYSSSDRIRVNQFAVKALLARLYLYEGSYPEAANEASSLLNQTELFQLGNNLEKVFLLTSKETIWQLQPQNSGQNTKEAQTFIFTSVPPSTIALNNNLVNSFTAADLRKISWIKQVTGKSGIWYHAFKYKEKNVTSISLEYSIVFRLAEQLLIRAEARAQQGDLIGAKEDLNKIRNRAGLQNTSAVTKEEIIQAVLSERRLELFTEHGHRFYDLKRLNQLDSQLSSTKPGWNTTDSLFPIPQTELKTNPNLLPQNPGY